jgi:excisionase family DNA binding protein
VTAPLLTTRQVAELLNVSRSWIYQAAKEGRIASVRLPGLDGQDGPVRFRRADLEPWLGSFPDSPGATVHVSLPDTRQEAP